MTVSGTFITGARASEGRPKPSVQTLIFCAQCKSTAHTLLINRPLINTRRATAALRGIHKGIKCSGCVWRTR